MWTHEHFCARMWLRITEVDSVSEKYKFIPPSRSIGQYRTGSYVFLHAYVGHYIFSMLSCSG